MVISNSKKFIFVHIHKCAGSSISKALQNHLTWKDFITGGTELGENMKKSWGKHWGIGKHSTAQSIRDLIGNDLWSKYYTFAFVRHPYNRITSLYNFTENKIKQQRWRKYVRFTPNQGEKGIWEWPTSKAFLDSKSFSEYIRHPELKKGPSFKPQYSFVSDKNGKLIIDYIGKVENIEEDFRKICSKIEIEFKLLHINKSKKTRNIGSHKDREYIAEVFSIDYKKFGYCI